MANYELNRRPRCPIVSERERHVAIGANCIGNDCVFALDGKCSIAYKTALEVQILEQNLLVKLGGKNQ